MDHPHSAVFERTDDTETATVQLLIETGATGRHITLTITTHDYPPTALSACFTESSPGNRRTWRALTELARAMALDSSTDPKG